MSIFNYLINILLLLCLVILIIIILLLKISIFIELLNIIYIWYLLLMKYDEFYKNFTSLRYLRTLEFLSLTEK